MDMERMKEKRPTTTVGWSIETIRSKLYSGGAISCGSPDGTSPTTGSEKRMYQRHCPTTWGWDV